MSAEPPLSFEEARRILSRLRSLSEDRRLVVIGGQAVGFWYREFERRGYISTPSAGPLTSKDLDFRGSRWAVERSAALLAGVARVPSIDDHTPSTGLVLFRDSEGRERQIDFLDAPYGLTARDVIKTAQRILLEDEHGGEVPAWVIHRSA